ncbi:putative Tubulin glycylase 3A [Blattamonas nauphoetae]|uniref:Tubulin glycylase 3A n=1 Tax=Blattamonas nauphoetae TaxID=2049346 RepID=A0ABQ9Y103_9EUKA|nr:putative Tubulin glycylase 3A [Blattamonas nauphoetae]
MTESQIWTITFDESDESEQHPVDQNDPSLFDEHGNRRKTFQIIRGGNSASDVRAALLRRNWVEYPATKNDCDIRWSILNKDIMWDTLRPSTMINHFQSSLCITTKGLLHKGILSSAHWEGLPPHEFYPLGFDLRDREEKQRFIQMYRLIECDRILRLYLNNLQSIPSTNPDEPLNQDSFSLRRQTALRKCLDYCISYVGSHSYDCDGDEVDLVKYSEDDWKFISPRLVYNPQMVSVKKAPQLGKENIFPSARAAITEINTVLESMAAALVPAKLLHCEGNVWIVKPVGKSRGRGIKCFNRLDDIYSYTRSGEDNWLVQKYIERPLLVHRHKFDIRVWVLLLSLSPLVIFVYQRPYLRLSSSLFSASPEDLANDWIHLTNNSIQALKDGVVEDSADGQTQTADTDNPSPTPHTVDPADAPYQTDPTILTNMMHLSSFLDYLQRVDDGVLPLSSAVNDPAALSSTSMKFKDEWTARTWPQICDIVVASIQTGREGITDRKKTFEIFGYDFMVDEEMRPWLIEINAAPCFQHTTPVTTELVADVVESTFKVVIDSDLQNVFDQPTSQPKEKNAKPQFGVLSLKERILQYQAQKNKESTEPDKEEEKETADEPEKSTPLLTEATISPFYQKEQILSEADKYDTGNWKLVYRERKEQVFCCLQMKRMRVEGKAIPLHPVEAALV